jgi:hypothetical protein
MCAGSLTAGTSSNSQSPRDDEFETHTRTLKARPAFSPSSCSAIIRPNGLAFLETGARKNGTGRHTSTRARVLASPAAVGSFCVLPAHLLAPEFAHTLI